ncbi:CsbD family protein [Palleronia marisminoris]|nr:CsbD family protein [Palleronia marisminoris]
MIAHPTNSRNGGQLCALAGTQHAPEDEQMNDNESKGHGKELKGKGKEMLGKVTGNEKTEAKGEGEQVEGKAQKNVGKAQDALKSDKDR